MFAICVVLKCCWKVHTRCQDHVRCRRNIAAPRVTRAPLRTAPLLTLHPRRRHPLTLNPRTTHAPIIICLGMSIVD